MRTRTANTLDPPRARSGPWLRFKAAAAADIAGDYGAKTNQALADFYGVHRSTYSRVVRGMLRPGEDFIAAVLVSHPDETRINFNALFELMTQEAA